MSTVMEKVSDEINASGMSQQEMKKRRPSGKHDYKPQLATKVKWALGDIMDLSFGTQERMKKIWGWVDEARQVADATHDTCLLALLGKLDHEIGGLALSVAEMERIAARTIAESKPAKDKA